MGGRGHTAKQKRGKPFRPPSTTTHDGSRHDTHMLVPAPLVCLALCGLDELHAPRHPHLPLPRADPHALTPRRAAFVLTCDAPLVSRRVERVGLCAVCALVDASSVSRAHAHARRRPAVPLNIRKSGTNQKQYAPPENKRSESRNAERGEGSRECMSPNGAPLSRQGKQWQLHSCCVVVVRAISSMYVVRLELSRFAHTPRTG